MISYIPWNVDPQVFDGFEYLRWYGLCWTLGIFLGFFIIQRIYTSEGIQSTELDMLIIYVLLGAIIGARMGHVLFYDPAYYLRNPIEILPIKLNPAFEFTGLAGLASHGGILGALLAVYLYSRKQTQSFFWLLDRLMIAGLALGGFIRIGNLMNSEIIGTPSGLPWAFVFSRVDQIPRHPSQLYEALFYFALCLVLYFIWKSGKFSGHNGVIFGWGMTLIFVQRFLVEFVKEDQVPFEQDITLNMGQILSIPLILVGIGVLIWRMKSPRKMLD